MAKKDFMDMMRTKTVDARPSLLSSEESIKKQLIVLDTLKELIPPLLPKEAQQLEENLLKHGVKDPLTIWETTQRVLNQEEEDTPAFVLIDGHNRYRIAQQHHLDYRINLIRFDSLDEAKGYMIDYQLGRRNLTPEQASYLRGLRYNQQKNQKGANLQTDTPAVNVAEQLASEYGVSSRTIRRDGEFAASLDHLPPTLKQEILSGNQKYTKADLAKRTKVDSESIPNEQGTTLVLTESKTNEALRQKIRKLATGPLTKQDCEKLVAHLTKLIRSTTT